jgi:hypothetical protein
MNLNQVVVSLTGIDTCAADLASGAASDSGNQAGACRDGYVTQDGARRASTPPVQTKRRRPRADIPDRLATIVSRCPPRLGSQKAARPVTPAGLDSGQVVEILRVAADHPFLLPLGNAKE